MKKNILAVVIVLLIFTACKNDFFKFNNLEISGLEIKPSSDTVPAVVMIYVDGSGDRGKINYKIYHEGAYCSMYGSEADTINSFSMSIDYSYILDKKVLGRDSFVTFYRHPGTYEVKLVVEDGDTFTETFTLF
ncbi:MAG: hypothetical protein GXO80_14280 [Chlorobi bacterium]|nr:hypothetical protein [Chlorobiota bacterium]